MRMQTDLMIALEPPGNIARELALFRRQFFARLGEASALAFPEIVPLAFAGSASASSRPGRQELASCWTGLEGSFASASAIESRGHLYLAMNGPLEELSSRAVAAFLAARLEAPMESPLATGLGCFLCRSSDPQRALQEAERIGVPRVNFRDCSIVLLGLRYGYTGPDRNREVDPLEALSWRELARARRHGVRP